MGKPLVGEVVVLPFPQTNLQSGKRRPALVVADLPGDDLVLCQVTRTERSDGYAIRLVLADFARGRLAVDSFIRSNRLFTVEQSVILYAAGKITEAKLQDVKARIRQLFV
ncbi:MAG: type II toxin-antitoxin system PemK/MazF family toxin [Verrucomicrobiae bacterium]|nr:type II toxin-antitoxin system PemK/MazF family toxin [Verrucomicrobiae bacterium]